MAVQVVVLVNESKKPWMESMVAVAPARAISPGLHEQSLMLSEPVLLAFLGDGHGVHASPPEVSL